MKKIQGLNVLERHDIERTCPSFYATGPKDNVSDRYTFLSTEQIAHILWNEGWMPTMAKEARSNKAENKGFTRHVVRWSNPDYAVNGERVELVGVNSHNRAAAFTFMAGIFRLVCSNGLVTKTSDFGEFKVKHMGDIKTQVFSAIQGISNSAKGIAGRMDALKAIELTPDEQGVFAQSAHSYIYKEPTSAPIVPAQLLLPRRATDAHDGQYNRYARHYASHSGYVLSYRPKRDLWTTYNVIQENALKGGIAGVNARGRRTKTRHIKSIDKDVKLNQALWVMAEEMANLKAA